jgi:hypothetical protein
LIFPLMAVLLWSLPLMAETYSWVDGQGTAHFTDDYSQVPRNFRAKVKRREDVSPPPSVQPPKEENSGTGDKVVKEGDTRKPAVTDEGSPGQAYGGKKTSEWQREFRERNAELGRLDATVKELSEFRKTAQVYGPALVDLNKRLNDAVEKYNESAKRYNELNDAANKAGVPVEFRK